jgi:hypothetical protein
MLGRHVYMIVMSRLLSRAEACTASRTVSLSRRVADSLTGSDEGPADAKRGRRRGKQQLAGPKKVGRPITFQGDINDPALSEHERRRIKRCVS